MCCNPNIVVTNHEVLLGDKDKDKDKKPLRENLKNNITSRVNTGMSVGTHGIGTLGTKVITDNEINLPQAKNRDFFSTKKSSELREFTIDNNPTGNEDQTIRIKNLSLIADNAPKLTLEVIQKIIINN